MLSVVRGENKKKRSLDYKGKSRHLIFVDLSLTKPQRSTTVETTLNKSPTLQNYSPGIKYDTSITPLTTDCMVPLLFRFLNGLKK